MKRVAFEERPDWQQDAEYVGFEFHTMDGERYWDERHAYQFSLDQIENDIEDPTQALLGMCYEAVARIVEEPELMNKLAIPEDFHFGVKQSWNNREFDLYGRFDFAYDGTGPAKMLEFNADTPTSLFEAAVFQWRWLEAMRASGKLPSNADQYNSIHERLIQSIPVIARGDKSIHFAAVSDAIEDWGTVTYLADCATQAGYKAKLIDIAHVGVDAGGWFTDPEDQQIENLFKLYPLEDMVREEFGQYLKHTPTRVIEPLWKIVLSNKGLLPILWEMFEGHPNLLPAYFDHDPRAASLGNSYVRKPLLSREGANVTIVDPKMGISVDGPYGGEGYVRQAFHALPRFGDDWAVIGSWVVAGKACGIGIREDDSPVTRNSSRFLPHFVVD